MSSIVEYIKFSLSSIKNNKIRFVLSMFNITLGVFLVTVIIIMAGSFKDKMYTEMKVSDEKVISIVQGRPESRASYYYSYPIFDDSHIDMIKKISSLKNVVGVKVWSPDSITAVNSKGQRKSVFTRIIGTKKLFLDNLGAIIEHGRIFKKGNEVVIGAKIAEIGSIQVGDKIEIEDSNRKYIFTVCGILKLQKPQMFSDTPDLINFMIAAPVDIDAFSNKKYGMISAKVNSINFLESTCKEIERILNSDNLIKSELKGWGLSVIAVSRMDVLKAINNWFRYIYFFILVVIIMVSLISVANITNTMITTVYERYQEIGIMKVVGASNLQIAAFYIFECAIIGILGTFIGLIPGILLSRLLVYIIKWNYITDNTLLFITCTVMGLISPLLAGYLASRKAVKLQLINALYKE
ncbi:ABC transporter permease [Caldicellulosiruptor morganii]|uniref:ABC transporter permease n=1 Tax=Caldicellulosiruptor morganii TaxID=1387555 RepID=A0ABY7BT31_9FIRM|nr:FtsX-like permease family protein [Caldicellulosiruptor morganii]MCX7654718.1 ABC transporter permease [Fervidobacterium sp.]WAM34899.1 ABC transporter permease [Caldicellulosiruptor morganii]